MKRIFNRSMAIQSWLKPIYILMIVGILLSACNAPTGGNNGVPEPIGTFSSTPTPTATSLQPEVVKPNGLTQLANLFKADTPAPSAIPDPASTGTAAPTNTPESPAAAPTETLVPTIAFTATPVLSDKVPGCVKVNASAERYETLWLRTDGSGIYDVTIEGTRLTSEKLYALAGKNPANEDHDVMIWSAGEEVIAIRGFELWDCGPKAGVSPKAIMELERQFAYKKSKSDNSVGVEHNIVIHFEDGTIKRYDNGADVSLPESMGGIDYSKCTVTNPSHQNTPGDVLDIKAVMTSTLGAPGCKSFFVGTDENGKAMAEFWTGVIERYSYIEGNFWVLPATYTVEDAVNFGSIKDAMTNLNITSVQNENGTTIYPK